MRNVIDDGDFVGVYAIGHKIKVEKLEITEIIRYRHLDDFSNMLSVGDVGEIVAIDKNMGLIAIKKDEGWFWCHYLDITFFND
jgi:hypothetical protein